MCKDILRYLFIFERSSMICERWRARVAGRMNLWHKWLIPNKWEFFYMANTTDAYLSRMVADNPCIAVRDTDGVVKKLDIIRMEVIGAAYRICGGQGNTANALGIGIRYVRKALKRWRAYRA